MLERDLKRAVSDYLQYKTNLGELYADQLFTGEAIEVRGKTRRKIQGCKKGTADFFVLTMFQCGLWVPRITFLELKVKKGKQTPEQIDFQEVVQEQGAEYYVIRSIEELEEVFK